MLKTTKEERLLKIQALQDELKILNEDTEPPDEIKTEEPQDDDERGEAPASSIEQKSRRSSLPIETIQKPKKKKQLTQKQLEALKKGTAAIRLKQAQMAKEKAEKQALEKEVLEKKLIDKAIKIKKKQIKQTKILFESESESEADDDERGFAPSSSIEQKSRRSSLSIEQPSRIQKPKVNKQLHPAPETPRIKLRFV